VPERCDFLSRASGQIAIAIENALAYHEISELQGQARTGKTLPGRGNSQRQRLERIIGKSAPLKHILELVDTVAPSDSTVLLLGETGTGKELIARAIHDRGRRKDRTFVKLNCAAIPTACWRANCLGTKGRVHRSHYAKNRAIGSSRPGHALPGRSRGHPLKFSRNCYALCRSANLNAWEARIRAKMNVRLVAATNRNLEKWLRTASFAVTCSTG